MSTRYPMYSGIAPGSTRTRSSTNMHTCIPGIYQVPGTRTWYIISYSYVARCCRVLGCFHSCSQYSEYWGPKYCEYWTHE